MKGSLDQHIDAQLKTSFDAIQKKAPTHLWKQISEEMDAADRMDASLDEKVQTAHLNAPLQKAPAPIWDKIDAALEDTNPIDTIIDKKIKDGFLSDSKAAPVFLWGAISEELSTPPVSVDTVLDEKLKDGFLTQETKKTPNKVWYAVSRQLNIDKTWSRISKVLDKEPVVSDWSGRMLRFFAVAVLLLLLLKTCTHEPYTLANTDFVHQVNTAQKVKTRPIATLGTIVDAELSKEAASKQPNNVSKEAEPTNSHFPTTSFPTTTTTNKRLTKKLPNSMPKHSSQNEAQASRKGGIFTILPPVENRSTTGAKEEPVIIAVAVPVESEVSEEEKNTSILATEVRPEVINGPVETKNQGEKSTESEGKEDLKPILLDALALNPLTVTNTVEPIQLLDEIALEKKKKTSKNLIEGKLEAGAFLVVNSTMLLNNETREGFDENSLTTNYFGLAANYGLWASYRILPRGALVAEFSINADNRQAYGTYQKGVFYIKEWVMKYNRFSLGYKHDLWQTDSDKFVHTKVVAQAGVYMGTLREAKLFYDGVLFFDKQSDYHQFDFGFKVALGQEILIDKFVIGYGIRSDIGVANIFKGNTQLKSRDDQTNIIHLGGYVLFGYRF